MTYGKISKLGIGFATLTSLIVNPSMIAGDTLPSHGELESALRSVVEAAQADALTSGPNWNGGLSNDMWATVVDRDGVVQAVAFTGEDRGEQWPGSRIISAQKAHTANAFSLPSSTSSPAAGLSLSTANLYAAVQPGGSLFGLQFSNPVDPGAAYKGPAKNFGTSNDPLVGERAGGVNVFGGGLALYDAEGELVGAIGVSGDTSCTDHIVAWKVRHALNLDNVVLGPSATGDDNIIFDLDANGNSAGGFGHPECGFNEASVAVNLPTSHPVGPNP